MNKPKTTIETLDKLMPKLHRHRQYLDKIIDYQPNGRNIQVSEHVAAIWALLKDTR